MTEMIRTKRGGLQAYARDVTRVKKPWGFELIYAVTETYCGKLLFVRGGQALSLQFHEHKDETIYLDEGLAEIEIGPPAGPLARETVCPGQAFRIRPQTVHRLRAIKDCFFLEVSTPHLDDVVRLEDRYGRAGQGSSHADGPHLTTEELERARRHGRTGGA